MNKQVKTKRLDIKDDGKKTYKLRGLNPDSLSKHIILRYFIETEWYLTWMKNTT